MDPTTSDSPPAMLRSPLRAAFLGQEMTKVSESKNGCSMFSVRDISISLQRTLQVWTDRRFTYTSLLPQPLSHITVLRMMRPTNSRSQRWWRSLVTMRCEGNFRFLQGGTSMALDPPLQYFSHTCGFWAVLSSCRAYRQNRSRVCQERRGRMALSVRLG